MVVLVAVVAFFVLVAAGFAFGLYGSSRDAVRKRALALRRGERRSRKVKAQASQSVSVKKASGRTLPVIEAFAKRFLPKQSILRDRLARTGLQLSIGGYLLMSVAFAVVGAIGAIVAGLPPAPSIPIGLVAGLLMPHLTVGFLIAHRRKSFLNLFPDAIDLIVRGVKSGLPVTESMAVVGRELDKPVGEEFRRISDGIRFGQPLDVVLWDTAQRLATPEFNFFVITISIQQETGGNLAETLNNLSDILRKRKQMRLKIKALSSEAKASAMILGALPLIMFGVLYGMNPEYETALLTDPRGHMMLAGGIGSLLVGTVVMAKMVRFEI
jgi:tight adherence protein B